MPEKTYRPVEEIHPFFEVTLPNGEIGAINCYSVNGYGQDSAGSAFVIVAGHERPLGMKFDSLVKQLFTCLEFTNQEEDEKEPIADKSFDDVGPSSMGLGSGDESRLTTQAPQTPPQPPKQQPKKRG